MVANEKRREDTLKRGIVLIYFLVHMFTILGFTFLIQIKDFSYL